MPFTSPFTFNDKISSSFTYFPDGCIPKSVKLPAFHCPVKVPSPLSIALASKYTISLSEAPDTEVSLKSSNLWLCFKKSSFLTFIHFSVVVSYINISLFVISVIDTFDKLSILSDKLK